MIKLKMILALLILFFASTSSFASYQVEIREILFNAVENSTQYNKDQINKLVDRIMAGDDSLVIKSLKTSNTSLVMLYDLSQTSGLKPNTYLSIELLDKTNSKVIFVKNALPARLTFHGVQVDMSFKTYTKFSLQAPVKIRKLSGDICSGFNISYVVGGGDLSCNKAGVSMSFNRAGVGILLGGSKATLSIFPFVFTSKY